MYELALYIPWFIWHTFRLTCIFCANFSLHFFNCARCGFFSFSLSFSLSRLTGVYVRVQIVWRLQYIDIQMRSFITIDSPNINIIWSYLVVLPVEIILWATYLICIAYEVKTFYVFSCHIFLNKPDHCKRYCSFHI